MWTPKRIILLAVGFAVFLGAYIVYAIFLGGIDGLPPLPVSLYPVSGSAGPAVEVVPPRPRENNADARLRMAFGEVCEEVGYNHKLELQPRGMVLATQDFKILDDGTILLTPFSLAIIREDHGAGGYPEINTVKCKQAILRFDRPVSKIFDIGSNRKIVGGELRDHIELVNNRRTKRSDDDISLLTQGPLNYDEARSLIWTDQDVRLIDPQSKPQPTVITGVGMDVYLSKDPRPSEKGRSEARRSRSEGPTGVERIRLRRDVTMDLWVDAQSGFLTSGKRPAENQPTPKLPPADSASRTPATAEKDKVLIKTQGPFLYDMHTDQATFEIAHTPGLRPNEVTVDRVKQSGDIDHLECDDRLELQFRRKNQGGAQAQGDAGGEGLEIETARAIGKEVFIHSDAEVLDAHGTDFSYDQRTHITTLKGSPKISVLKEGTEIIAAELQLLDQKGAQQATALGEGQINLMDKATGKRPIEASWSRKLVYVKEGNHDVLTLSGDAVFKDLEHKQELRAETLKVWLAPAEPAPGSNGGQEQRRKPEHLDAVEHVSADGPELRIHETEHLEVWFKDAPARSGTLPAAMPIRPEAADGGNSPLTKELDPKRIPLDKGPERVGGGGLIPGTAADPAKSKKPLNVSAKLVQAYVLRTESKNDLEKVNCEGAVRVVQEPASPGEKGVDIRGEYLELNHFVDCNKLKVVGDHAQVQLNQICIVGPEVSINQATNEAWVNGTGVMRMPSKNNFDGTPLAREAELVINWEKSMYFDGRTAVFRGGVRATQDQGHLATDAMTVTMDHKVSLREGDKTNPPAKVQQLVCERKVWVEDSTIRDRKLISYKRIQGLELWADVDNEKNDSIVEVAGPGVVRIFQLGSKAEMFPAPGAAGNQASPAGASQDRKQRPSRTEEEFKLTQVLFQEKMQANNKQGIANFFGGVVVFHVPTQDKDLRINELAPPPECMRLSCRQLKVLSLKMADGTMQQEMTASGRVSIIGQNFEGSADVAKHDESKGQLILEGTENNRAVLVKQQGKGTERQTFRARKIMYWPKTGEVKADDATMLNGVK